MRKSSLDAFTLVEVTLALGITAFCMISLLGLLPIGLNASRNSVEQTTAASVANMVVADIRTQAANNSRMPPSAAGKSPQYGFDLTAVSSATSPTVQTLYVSADGTFVPVGTAVAPPSALYRVSLAFFTPAQPATATPLRVLVTWPAQAGGAPVNAWPKLASVSGSFEVITAVDLPQ